jgi:xanthine dehydrogenase small subunit
VEKGELSYKAVNACIQYIYQLDGMHIVTVEGLRTSADLNPIQKAMVDCNGAQCGYCTPGIVTTLCGFFNDKTNTQPATSQEIRDALTGNLCRCTGYESILNAGTSVDVAHFAKLPALYPSKEMVTDLARCQQESVTVETFERRFFTPTSVAEAVAFKRDNPGLTVISGGTDVSVVCNKRHVEPSVVMSLAHLRELDTIVQKDGCVVVGARASLVKLEQFIQDIYPEFYQILEVFGSPQIKQAGTLAGNIANGSPIGDSLPFLYVMDAEVELTSVSGSRRVNINQLYTGYRSLAMNTDELITRVFIPLLKPEETLKLYKVSKRKHLDISTFTAAIRMTITNNAMQDVSIAYGGVGPVVLRLPKTEAFLQGKPTSLDIFQEAGKIAVTEITPISDVRGNRDFRLQLAENILQKFYWEAVATQEGIPA